MEQLHTDRSSKDNQAMLVGLVALVVATLILIFGLSGSPALNATQAAETAKRQGESEREISALSSSLDGLLVATADGGLGNLVNDTVSPIHDIAGKIACVLPTEAGLWVATETDTGSDLLLVKGAYSAAPQVQRIAMGNGAENGHIRALANGFGRLWVGTETGLYSYDWTPWTRLTPPSRYRVPGGLTNVSSLYVDPHGVLWVGTPKGIVSYNGSEYFRHNVSEGLPSDRVTAISGDNSGLLVVGTEKGAVTWQSGIWVRQAAVSDKVTAILAAEDDIWIGTDRGLFHRLDGQWVDLVASKLLSPCRVTALAYGKDQLCIGTDKGLYRLSLNTAAGKEEAKASEPAK